MALRYTVRKFLSLLLSPRKGLDYFLDYYRTVEQIVVHRNWKLRAAVHLINLLVALKMFHFGYLGLGERNLSELRTAIHFDVLYQLVGKSYYNLLPVHGSMMLIYMNWIYFFSANNLAVLKQLAVCMRVIISPEQEWFLKAPLDCAVKLRKSLLLSFKLFFTSVAISFRKSRVFVEFW